jgi:hypothetical protein
MTAQAIAMLQRHVNKRGRLASATFCIVIFLCPLLARGQAVGIISGTVADPSGAVIPNASVKLTHSGTATSRSVTTNSDGIYFAANLLVGTYSISVSAPGLAAKTVPDVQLDVSQQRVVNFILMVGTSAETMEITAEPPSLNTTDATLAGVVTEQQVADMPLNGRSIQNLVMFQPGMAPDSGHMGWMAPQWISDGNRGETEVATLDDADASDWEWGVVEFWNFNLDAIEEFKVQQSNYSAQFGQGGGSITQIVTKQGTNNFHGSMYEFLRNTVFDTRNYFATTVPAFQRNEFGATFGGPVLKNKAFFFGEWAGLRQRQGFATVMPVPTSAERTGLIQIGNFDYQVPLNPVAAQVLGKYPQPNQPAGIFGPRTYNTIIKEPTNMDQFSVRLDYPISDKDSLFGRASYINNNAQETDNIAAAEDPSFSNALTNNPRNFVIGETHIFSPNLVNRGNVSVNRRIVSIPTPNQQFTQSAFSDGSLATWGPDTFVSGETNTSYALSESLYWNKGKHAIVAGVDYHYFQMNGYGVFNFGPNGQYQFSPGTPLPADIPSTNGGPTIRAGTASPNSLVSMMEGAASVYGRASPMPGFGPAGGLAHWGLRNWYLANFVEDDIKVNRKLVLNLGARYEYNSVPYEPRNRLGGLVDSGPLFGHFVINPEPLYKPDKLNLVPRVGFAWSATGATVVRGGYAIFTNVIPLVYPEQAAVNFPLSVFGLQSNPVYSLIPQPVNLPVLMSDSGAVLPPNGNTKLILPNTPVNLAPIAAITGNVSGNWPGKNLRNGYTEAANLTIERSLPADVFLQASYVLSTGIHLSNNTYPNAYTGAVRSRTPYSNITPGLGEFQLVESQGISHYNALQVQVKKTSPRHGLQFQANYTWSKVLTDADSLFSAQKFSSGETLDDPTCIKCEYARASFDVGQRFVANASYSLPQSWRAVPKSISSGWQILGIYNDQSGFPFTITSPFGTQEFGFDTVDNAGTRPFFIMQAPRNPQQGVPQFFAPSVVANHGLNGVYWSVPTTTNATLGKVQTAPGNLGRNTYTSPSWWNMDFALTKVTRVRESFTMQFRAEAFNIFNHPTFATGKKMGLLGSSSFGLSTATISTERQLQFGLRVIF